ncbi:nitroreductase/quinone reductase family protein [Antribacter gilvus]|uniref:nitroreductase/quinone reductase family protein n=1 Tax=Antribacter gilvus TaxID=2304675 RepID=UPI000F77862C|nr:nitroreductase/quinone reductase family protein [Antribacter gilvus]
MSFSHPKGTHGTHIPNWLFRWGNKLLAPRARRSGRPMMGMNILVLTTVGRKSGEKRVSPLAWFPDPSGGWLVVASVGGSATNPGWYHNLAAHPDQVTVELAGRKVAAVAEELQGAERDEAWGRIIAEAKQFADYQEKTDRRLPVIRLTPRD